MELVVLLIGLFLQFLTAFELNDSGCGASCRFGILNHSAMLVFL